MQDNEFNPFLGIDLGTTFSAIARWDGRSPVHYQMSNGEDVLQSVVYIDPRNNEKIVGSQAYRLGLLDPVNMVLGVKRLMDHGNEPFTVAGQEFTPTQISAIILRRLHSDVLNMFPTNRFQDRGVVVTVPYYFKAHQCEATRLAAQEAGLQCMGLLQEPIAASLRYALQLIQADPVGSGKQRVLVFDLGGGTFDLTLFDLTYSPEQIIFEVLGSGGDDRLGGWISTTHSQITW